MNRARAALSERSCRSLPAFPRSAFLPFGNLRQIGIGLLGLAAGFFFYAMFRWQSPPLVQALVGTHWYLGRSLPPALRSSMQSLPTALHVFAFSLLTIGVAGVTRWRSRIACVALWVGINWAFEFLQGVDRAAFHRIMAAIPWHFDSLQQFVLHGTCDPRDVLAAVSGGLAALIVSSLTGEKEKKHVA